MSTLFTAKSPKPFQSLTHSMHFTSIGGMNPFTFSLHPIHRIVNTSKAGFLNLDITDILGWRILVVGLSWALERNAEQHSIPELYPMDADSIRPLFPVLWKPKMSPNVPWWGAGGGKNHAQRRTTNLRGRGPTPGDSVLWARCHAWPFTLSLLILPDKIQLKENNADMIPIF